VGQHGFSRFGCWGLYFASANKALPIGPIVNAFFRLTQPIAAITVSYFDFPRGLTSIVVENAVTYALIGLIVEAIRQRYRLIQISH